jgi:hypothetical protein
MTRRAVWIWENLPPGLKVNEGRDLDPVEKVFPGARNPRFGDKAAHFESLGFLA